MQASPPSPLVAFQLATFLHLSPSLSRLHLMVQSSTLTPRCLIGGLIGGNLTTGKMIKLGGEFAVMMHVECDPDK